MANPLFQRQENTQPNEQMYNEFRQDPTAYLVKCGLQIPADFSGDYRALVQHLAQTGQIPPMLQGGVNAMLGRR